MAQLIRTEAQVTRAHITTELGHTRDLFNKNVETEFPEMNARENAIEQASEDTANWIFSDTIQDGQNYFLQQLELHPTIRIQGLTRPAMKAYIERTLSQYEYDLDTTTSGYRNFVHELLAKSDGVFLWVAMALQSLLRGSQNGDAWDILRQITQELSPGLNGLFKQMWERQRLFELYLWEFGYTIIIIATCPPLWHELQAIVRDNGPDDPPKRLDHLRIHRKFEEWLFLRSAGLLQIRPLKDEINLCRNTVKVIHRLRKGISPAQEW
ncbi:hypothetical protein F5X96DRAFT_691487 [Biscogniauxia mediterranea]|nr:hypothetical protein F5X96DRAFT_691487 [Biscogniauxia mediterranea]